MKATGHVSLDEPFAGMFTQGMVVHETYKKQDGTFASPTEINITGDGTTRSATRDRHHRWRSAPSRRCRSRSATPSTLTRSSPMAPIPRAGSCCRTLLPDRDVIWSEEGVKGASRFVQRLWRMVNEAAVAHGKNAPATKPAAFSPGSIGGPEGRSWCARQASRPVLRSCSSMCASPISANSPMLLAKRWPGRAHRRRTCAGSNEAAVILVQLFAPMMPHLAEVDGVGQTGLVSEATWGRRCRPICWSRTRSPCPFRSRAKREKSQFRAKRTTWKLRLPLWPSCCKQCWTVSRPRRSSWCRRGS